jgi:hypothetical protein
MALGATPVRADEVSDLRANQELLQQRIDQLAQARVPGDMYGVTGGPAISPDPRHRSAQYRGARTLRNTQRSR